MHIVQRPTIMTPQTCYAILSAAGPYACITQSEAGLRVQLRLQATQQQVACLCKLLPFLRHLFQDVGAAEDGFQVLPGGLACEPVVQQILQQHKQRGGSTLQQSPIWPRHVQFPLYFCFLWLRCALALCRQAKVQLQCDSNGQLFTWAPSSSCSQATAAASRGLMKGLARIAWVFTTWSSSRTCAQSRTAFFDNAVFYYHCAHAACATR